MRSATLSQDGTRLAYSVGRRIGNAYRVPFRRDRAATWADAEQLTFDQAGVQCLDLDPGGTRLALSSNRSGSFDLWTMPAAGGSLTQVTSDPSAEWCPVWSPDGTSFAFFAYRSGNRDVWTMPATGGEWKQITTNPGADLHPRWTSDGKAVVYLSARGTTIGMFQSTFDGAPDQLVSSSPTGGRISPTDRLLVRRDTESRISVLDLEGRRAPRTFAVRSETVPNWSNDGRQLIVRSAVDRLTIVNVDSGAERALVDLSGRRGSLNVYGTPTDGQFVYFIWEEDLGDIWTMDVESVTPDAAALRGRRARP
jgi:Tol biopolymer transport system component